MARMIHSLFGFLSISGVILIFYKLNTFTTRIRPASRASPFRISLTTRSQPPGGPRPALFAQVESQVPPEVLEWMNMCSEMETRVIILQAELLSKTSQPDGSSPNPEKLSTVKFGILEKDVHKKLGKLIERTLASGWEQLFQEKSGRRQFTFEKNEITLKLGVMQEKSGAWLLDESKIPRAPGDPARAFLGLTIERIRWPPRSTNGSLFVPHPLESYLWQAPISRLIECNRTSARRLRSMYPKVYDQPIALGGPSRLDELAYVRDLLMAERVVPMLASELALGWYRECDLSPNLTTSFELMFPYTDWRPSILDKLKRDPRIERVSTSGKLDDSLSIKIQTVNSSITLFAMYRNESTNWIQEGHSKRVYPRSDEICTCVLNGHLFHIRCYIVDQLEFDYGEQWYEIGARRRSGASKRKLGPRIDPTEDHFVAS